MIVYLDTSAALTILIDEVETAPMRESFNGWQLGGDVALDVDLLVTYDRELAGAAAREGIRQVGPA